MCQPHFWNVKRQRSLVNTRQSKFYFRILWFMHGQWWWVLIEHDLCKSQSQTFWSKWTIFEFVFDTIRKKKCPDRLIAHVRFAFRCLISYFQSQNNFWHSVQQFIIMFVFNVFEYVKFLVLISTSHPEHIHAIQTFWQN